MAWANDNLANATALSGASGSITPLAYDGTTDPATSETGESYSDAGETLWWTWTVPTSGDYEFNTVGSPSIPTSADGLDTWIGVYSGPSSSPTFAALTLVDSNDDNTAGDTYDYNSRVIFTATAGQTYYIQVDQYAAGQAGTLHLAWGPYTPPPPPPTITSLRGVNAYDPSLDFLITFDGQQVYATGTDFWLIVLGTNLDLTGAVAFTKSGESDRPADFTIVSSTRLDVKIPMTVLANSHVTVSNGGGSATSIRNVTAVFAGPWRTEPTVTFDTYDFPTNPNRWATVFTSTSGAAGASTIGPNSNGTGPPIRTFTDIVDNPDTPGAGQIPVVTNTIVNRLYDPTVPRSDTVDDVELDVAQVGIKVDMRQVFYRVMADLGVPGYYDTSLLPADAVEAIPDGTDREGPFFDARFTALDLTVHGYNDLCDNYEIVEEIGTGGGADGYYDLSALATASRDDAVEFRAVSLTDALTFRSTTQLGADALIASLDVPPIPVLRTPAPQESYPYAPILADPDVLAVNLDVLAHVDTSQVAYTAALASYRTYDAPPDPGEAPILTWTWTSSGTSETQQGRWRTRGANVVLSDSLDIVGGISARTRHVARIQATWTPPRYRYWYTTPLPATTSGWTVGSIAMT